jgi:peptidylprolyl isomerase
VTIPDGPPPPQLLVEDLRTGTGADAVAGKNVLVLYLGVSWSTKEAVRPVLGPRAGLPFRLGAGQVIAGWDQGVAAMRVGGRRKLIIPPGLGYGPGGYPPLIGPNETLVFVVDLVAVQ